MVDHCLIHEALQDGPLPNWHSSRLTMGKETVVLHLIMLISLAT